MLTYNELVQIFHNAMANPFELAVREDFSQAAELPDNSAKGIEAKLREKRQAATSIRINLRNDDLTREQKLELDLAANWLQATILEEEALVHGEPIYRVKPTAMSAFLKPTTNSLMRDSRPAAKILDDVIKRLEQLPGYLDRELSRLKGSSLVDVWTRTEQLNAAGFDSFARGLRAYAVKHKYKEMDKLESVLSTAKTNVHIYIIELIRKRRDRHLSIGARATGDLLKYKGIELSPDQIHDLAKSQLESAWGELEQMRSRLVEKYSLDRKSTVHQVGDFLEERFPAPKKKFFDFVKEMMRKAEEFAYDCGLVQRRDNIEATVIKTPPYLDVPVAAVDTPGSFGRDRKRTIFYVTKIPGVEKVLNKMNLPVICAHEVLPGLGYQLARATEHPSSIRAWIKADDLSEGWATYVSEELMQQRGFVGTEGLQLEEAYMVKTDRLRLAARVCFMLTCLTGNRKYLQNPLATLPKDDVEMIEACTQVYEGITGFSSERARRDITILSWLSTYGVLYLVGNQGLKNLEKQAEAHQGDKFRKEAFLENVLREGNMPISYVRRALKLKDLV